MSLNKKSNPAATAVNNAGTHKTEEDSIGITAGYILTLESSVKTASASALEEMYVSDVKFAGNSKEIEKFAFTKDRNKAMSIPKKDAYRLSSQISNGDFGSIRAQMILAYNYDDMFKGMEKNMQLTPENTQGIKNEITWAKQHLKKQDRIIWFLRIYRLFLFIKLNGGIRQFETGRGPAMGRGNKPAPMPEGEGMPEGVPGEGRKPKNVLENLYKQYSKGVEAVPQNDDQMYDLKEQLEHYYGIPVSEIQDKVLGYENYQTLMREFAAFEKEWKEQASHLVKPKPEDKIFMQFPDGWAWWHLPRPCCDEESRAMGHCGNSPMRGRSGVSILSLRKPVPSGKEGTLWFPHLTFILHGEGDSGILGEMKGRNNDKPVARYHPYIISLLKDRRILGIKGGGYLPEHNFALADLTSEQRRDIAKTNPAVGLTLQDHLEEFGMDESYMNRVKTLLEIPTAIPNGDNIIIRQWDNEAKFVEDCGEREAKSAIEFVETGKNTHSEPDEEELSDQLVGGLDETQIKNLGLDIKYNYPKEIKEWFGSGYNPQDLDQVKQAVRYLYETYVTDKNEPGYDEPGYGYDNPILINLLEAWVGGGPNKEQVKNLLDEKIQAVKNGEEGNTSQIFKSEDGKLIQVLDEIGRAHV